MFCAGADLKVIRETGTAATLDTERGGFGGFVYREREKPIVVAVDGLATAGGMEIVLAADVVVATTRSSFGLAEVRHNLIAAAGGLFRLPRAIGRAPAMDAILTGEPIDATRAYQLGLVSRLAEPGAALDTAMDVARAIAAAAPLAVRASRTGRARRRARRRRRRCARSRARCSTSCSSRTTRPKDCVRSPRSARPSGRDADAATPPSTVVPDDQRRHRRLQAQREVEGTARRDHRHVGDGVRPERLPRHRHRRALRGQRLRQGRVLLLHRLEGRAPRRHPRPGDGRGAARAPTASSPRADHRRSSSRCSAPSCST